MAVLQLGLVLVFMLTFNYILGFRISRHSAGCRFTPYPGYALYGHNDQTLPDTSVDTCKQTCLNNARCLSLDINHNTQSCFISYNSKDTLPDAYGRHSSSTYFQKQCGGYVDEDNDDDEDNDPGSGEDIQCVQQYGPFGGSNGDAFSDEAFYKGGGVVTGIIIQHGIYIDCIGLEYDMIAGPCHGGSGGNRDVIRLHTGEVITSVSGRKGDLLDQITFITNRRAYGPYGSSGGKPFTANGAGGLAYISGRSGRFLDQITFHFKKNYC